MPALAGKVSIQGLGAAQAFLNGPDDGEVWLGSRGARVLVQGRQVAEVTLLDGHPPRGPEAGLDQAPPVLAAALEQIGQYLQGSRRQFDLPLFLDGSPFYRDVWQALAQVPYGEVLTYGELAARCKKPGASRAVGTAMNRNKLPLLVPCHRVVAAGGKLGGFSCGVEWKKWLLKLERGEQGLVWVA